MKLTEMLNVQEMEDVAKQKKSKNQSQNQRKRSNVLASVYLSPCPHCVIVLQTFCITPILVTKEQFVVNQNQQNLKPQNHPGKVNDRAESLSI